MQVKQGNPSYLVLKYYYYVPIQDPVAFREKHHLHCIQLNLRGRIKIASEGINGTISGEKADCYKYMRYLRSDSRFKDIEFNTTPSETHVHEKLHVRLKPEIIRADIPCQIDERTHQSGREYIDATDFEKIRHKKDVVLMDLRSISEYKLGKFPGSITFDIDNFRSFFKQTQEYSFDRNKKYIVICTRGIKSVKGWHYLKYTHQLPHVYYLRGGILDYAQQTDGGGFEGVCYVFDKRLVVPINSRNPTTRSKCYQCQEPCNRMINCANPSCNAHLPMCVVCSQKLAGGCSTSCAQHPAKRPYNGTGYYFKQPHGYNPYIGAKRHIEST